MLNKNKFSSRIDKNGDNQVNLTEFCDWNSPYYKKMLNKLVNEIIKRCDLNGDFKLSKQEIIINASVFKAFEFTNYGDDFSVKKNNKIDDENDEEEYLHTEL